MDQAQTCSQKRLPGFVDDVDLVVGCRVTSGQDGDLFERELWLSHQLPIST